MQPLEEGSQAEENTVRSILDSLNISHIPDSKNEVHQEKSERSQNPEFCQYLVSILALRNDPGLNTIRKTASSCSSGCLSQLLGASLKGFLERNWDKIPSQLLKYVKERLLQMLDDQDLSMRNTVTDVIAVLFSKTGFKHWPELFKFFEIKLDSRNQEGVDSTLECCSTIFEDIDINSENIDLSTGDNSHPFHNVISKLMLKCKPDFPVTIRDGCLQTLNSEFKVPR